MALTRLIARLDIRNGNLIKPIRLEGVRIVGDPAIYAEGYCDEGISEILLMDAVASLYGRNTLDTLITHFNENIFIPLGVGGGIRTLDEAKRVIGLGCEKVAINTGAIERPKLITEVAMTCGSQAMAIQIDAKRIGDKWEAFTHGGRNHTGKDAIEWAKEATQRGAGEILLTSIDREGTCSGFDLELVMEVSSVVNVPVIASGGMGKPQDLIDAIEAGAHAVAMANVLHYRKFTLNEIRDTARQAGIAA